MLVGCGGRVGAGWHAHLPRAREPRVIPQLFRREQQLSARDLVSRKEGEADLIDVTVDIVVRVEEGVWLGDGDEDGAALLDGEGVLGVAPP